MLRKGQDKAERMPSTSKCSPKKSIPVNQLWGTYDQIFLIYQAKVRILLAGQEDSKTRIPKWFQLVKKINKPRKKAKQLWIEIGLWRPLERRSRTLPDQGRQEPWPAAKQRHGEPSGLEWLQQQQQLSRTYQKPCYTQSWIKNKQVSFLKMRRVQKECTLISVHIRLFPYQAFEPQHLKNGRHWKT